MKTRVLAVAVALTLAPALGFAECSFGKQQAMSCADGTTYDAETGTCVAVNA